MSEETVKTVLDLLGNITATRVMESREGRSVIEISFSANGTFGEHDVAGFFTYEAEAISSDSFIGSGKAVLQATDGDGAATIKATGAVQRAAGATQLVWRAHGAVQSSARKFADWHGRLLDITVHVGDDQKVSLQAARWT
ncbi:hypothetical protein [Streptomyces sp. NPDC017529]|uniref:hypothetical protein n=1 Tax=Streptomyces sp. NPDC017529 TaxID=3365000 RepID=UPI0037B04A8E